MQTCLRYNKTCNMSKYIEYERLKILVRKITQPDLWKMHDHYNLVTHIILGFNIYIYPDCIG